MPTYCTYRCSVSSTSLVFDFGCSFSLVTAKGPTENAKGSVIDLNTDSSYLLVSPGLEMMVGSSRRSPQTRRGARRDGGEGEGQGEGEGEGEDEGGGGWGGWCWRTPPLGDSLSCRWAPVEGTTNKTTSRQKKNIYIGRL